MATKKAESLAYKEIALDGKLITAIDATRIGPNFRSLQNMRYTDASPQAIGGMSKINTTIPTTYFKVRSGFHFVKSVPEVESHVLVQAWNTGLTASQVLQNTTAVPTAGDFSATALHTDASGASTGYFSGAPQGAVAYCNSKESMIWAGDEDRCPAFINYDETAAAFEYDFSDIINNDKTDASNIATILSSANEAAFYVGALRPIKNIELYIGTANTTAATISGEYWDGSAWQSLTTLVDNTATGGVTMGLTGGNTITFDDTEPVAKVKSINTLVLYWYKFQTNTPIDVTTTVYKCTLDASFQSIKDLWDGEYRVTTSTVVTAAGAADGEFASHVFSENFSNAGGQDDNSTFLDMNGYATTTFLIVGFTERVAGIRMVFEGSKVNTTASVLTVKYWNGTAWVAVSDLDDGTIKATGKTLSGTGTVSWTSPSKQSEFKKTLTDVPHFYYRFEWSVSLSASSIFLDYVGGISAQEEIGNYKFPMFAHDRLILCSDQDGNKNEALVSAKHTNTVFNGEDSTVLSFGDARELTAGAGMFRQYGSALYKLTVITKADETWVVTGDSPEEYVQYQASDVKGCVAPATLKVAHVNFDNEQSSSLNRYITIFQGANGIHLYDGSVLIDIHDDIKDLFDKRLSTSINTSKLKDSVGFFDEFNQEYHWLFAAGTSTTLDKEFVYDLKRGKWYDISRGPGLALQVGFEVSDTDKNTYNYGTIDTGYMEHLENGTSFDGTAIACIMDLGDVNLSEGLSTEQTQIRALKLTQVAKTTTANSATLTHYGDTEDTGEALTYSPSASGKRVSSVVNSTGLGPHTYHRIKMEMSTDDETIGFEPLVLAAAYKVIRQDLS